MQEGADAREGKVYVGMERVLMSSCECAEMLRRRGWQKMRMARLMRTFGHRLLRTALKVVKLAVCPFPAASWQLQC